MIRALIVDDHAVVRSGIVHIIADTHDIVCADQTGKGSEALQLVHKHDYDVVVLDIRLPDSSGLDILKQMRNFKPRLRVLMLSMYPEKQYATRAFKAGALGYMTKDSIPEELIVAIHKVARGERYVSQSFGELLASQVGDQNGQEPHEALSDREDQVVRLLASGKTVTQIADKLALSAKTVSTYRTRSLEKLKLNTTSELIRYVIEKKLDE